MYLLNECVKFILFMTQKHKIDDSHGISHSFNILHYTNHIYQDESLRNPQLREQENVIFIASLIHDMCDKKYMKEEEGMISIIDFLKKKISDEEIICIKTIIETMSYSKVIKNGFPELGEYQLAYHIVREADLLCAYDVDRCMIFHLFNSTENNIENAFQTAEQLFDSRVFTHRENGLILLDYTKKMVPLLETQSIMRMNTWRQIMKIK